MIRVFTDKVELTSWRELNCDNLKKMFPDPSIAKKYDDTSNGAFLLVTQNSLDAYEGYKGEIAHEVGYLKTCIKKLQFFDEAEASQYVFPAGQQFSAFLVVNEILKRATKSILLVDGYVDEKTLAILSIKQPAVELQLLTKAKSINANFKAGVQNFQKQHGKLEVRVTEDLIAP